MLKSIRAPISCWCKLRAQEVKLQICKFIYFFFFFRKKQLLSTDFRLAVTAGISCIQYNFEVLICLPSVFWCIWAFLAGPSFPLPPTSATSMDKCWSEWEVPGRRWHCSVCRCTFTGRDTLLPSSDLIWTGSLVALAILFISKSFFGHFCVQIPDWRSTRPRHSLLNAQRVTAPQRSYAISWRRFRLAPSR